MSLYTRYKTDKRLIEKGVYIEFPVNEDGELKGRKPRFLIARMSHTNPIYVKELERASRPYKREIELDQLDAETNHRVTMEIFLNVILLGWEHVQGEDGKLLQFNHENAQKLLTDLPDLYAELQKQSTLMSNFRAEQLKKEAKN